MAQYLSKVEGETAQALTQAEAKLAALTKSKAWEAGKTAADLACIVDPTPASDLISMGMSMAEGDWVGALLSGTSFVPYLGDALAKPIKFARAAKTVKAIEREAAALAKVIDAYKNTAAKFAQRKLAAAAERARRAKEAAEACAKKGNIQGCNPWGAPVPEKGFAGTRGDSMWTSANGKVSVEFERGYPNFKKSNPPALHPDGGGEVEIFQSKDRGADFEAAAEQMRKKLGDNTWPGNGDNKPTGYVWHHKEDGVTMQLVKKEVHNVANGGGSHAGGVSIVSGNQSQF